MILPAGLPQGGLPGQALTLVATNELGWADNEPTPDNPTYINVQAAPFNAQGDGVTDDTAAIQAAFNSVTAQSNIVYFPTPTAFYKTSAPITDPTNGLLQGVLGQSGGVTPGAVVINRTGTSAFLFTHVSAIGFQIQNMRWVGPGRGVNSSDGWILGNVTGAPLAVSGVVAANGTGLTVYDMASTTGLVVGGYVYTTGFSEAPNNGFLQIQSIQTNVSITVFSNIGQTDTGGGTVQGCGNVQRLIVNNVQGTSWGGVYARGLHIVSPITGSISDWRFDNGTHGLYLNGGTSVTVFGGYGLSLDKSGYDITNSSYHALLADAADLCGIGYLLRGLCTAVSGLSCGSEAGTAFNLNVTNSVAGGGTATVTYSGEDQSGDYYPGISVVIAGTANGAGALNGRVAAESMSANTLTFASAATFASAPDTGTASVWPGDGYCMTNVQQCGFYAPKRTSPEQTTSSAVVMQSCVQTFVRDGTFIQGGGSLETNTVDVYRGCTNVVVVNSPIPSGSLIAGSPLELLDGESLEIGQYQAATALNNPSSGSFRIQCNYWTGAAVNSPAYWSVQVVPGQSSNTPATNLQFTFSAGSGGAIPQVQYSPGQFVGGWAVQYLNKGAGSNVGQNYSTPLFQFVGSSWTGTASQNEGWALQGLVGAGANPANFFKISRYLGGTGEAGIITDAATVFGWSASAIVTTAVFDTGISRSSAGIVAFGVGPSGDITGGIKAATGVFSGALSCAGLTCTSVTDSTQVAGTVVCSASGVFTSTSTGSLTCGGLTFPATLGASGLIAFASATAAAQSIQISAQNGSGAASNGGNLLLFAGAPGSSGSNGVVRLGVNGSTAIQCSVNPGAAVSLNPVASSTSCTYQQTSTATNSATGAPSTFAAQDATGTTSTGGACTFRGGTGTTAYGQTNIGSTLNLGSFTQAMTSVPVSLSAANSAKGILIVTGTITGTPTLTLAESPTAGLFKLIRNNGSGTIAVAWASGTGVNVASGTAALVGSDGTNAILLLAGT